MTRQPPPAVSVHEISNGGYTGPKWLCPAHVEARRASGWTVKVGMPLPDGSRCGDCVVAEQGAPEYRTPTVDFAPTDPSSHLPTRAEVRLMPGVAPMKPSTPKPRPRAEGKAA